MKRSKGFTLIEVVIAMTIVAIALISLVEATGIYVKNTGYLRDKVIAGWVASNALNETILKESFPPEGSKDGKEEMAGKEWKWKIKTTKTENPFMREIEVKVFKGNEKSSLSTFKSTVSSAVRECGSNSPQQVVCP